MLLRRKVRNNIAKNLLRVNIVRKSKIIFEYKFLRFPGAHIYCECRNLLKWQLTPKAKNVKIYLTWQRLI